MWCLCPDGAYAPLSTVVKKEDINFVKKSILVAQTCPHQQNNSKCNIELFLNLGCYFNCLFQDVMSGRNCFLPNFFSQKGKHENLGTLSTCGLTKVHLECWLVLVEYSVGCGDSSFDIYQPPLIWAAFGLGFYLVNGDTHLLFVCIPQFIERTVQCKQNRIHLAGTGRRRKL